MLGIILLGAFALGFFMSIKIIKTARKGADKRVLYNVSGCVNYKYALAIGIAGFSILGGFLWLSILGYVATIILAAH